MMENNMAAVEQDIKIEVGEIKVEKAEVDFEWVGIEQNNWGLAVKTENDETTDRLRDLQSSPEEEIQRRHFFVCEESNDVLYSCYKCDYITSQKYNLINHMEDHHSRNRSNIPVMCTDCNSAFRRKLDLDEHIIRKHPHLIATLNRTILKCTYCAYQTVLKHLIDRHMLKHPETADNYELKICVHCNGKFKRKTSLDNHTIRKHPHCIASISSKIHKCTYCAYSTVLKHLFVRHMLKHPETVNNYKHKICTHCNAKFNRKTCLDNHIIRAHPDSIDSISSKIHKCTYCAFQTVLKHLFNRHMLKHHANQTQVISRVEEISSEND